MSRRLSKIDINVDGVFLEKHFNAKDLIRLHTGWKCEKCIADNHNKSMKFFTDHAANCSGDDVERTLGL